MDNLQGLAPNFLYPLEIGSRGGNDDLSALMGNIGAATGVDFGGMAPGAIATPDFGATAAPANLATQGASAIGNVLGGTPAAATTGPAQASGGAQPAGHVAGPNQAGGFSNKYDGMIADAAAKYGVDANMVKAVISQESNFNTNAHNKKSGALGLGQLMAGTAKELGVKNRRDPAQSIDGTAHYLSKMMDKFKDKDLALAAYNAGPGNVKKAGGIPHFKETQNYVKSVNQKMEALKAGTPAVKDAKATTETDKSKKSESSKSDTGHGHAGGPSASSEGHGGAGPAGGAGHGGGGAGGAGGAGGGGGKK